MAAQKCLSIKYEIRKNIFNIVRRNPRILDIVAVAIAIMFNVVLIYMIDLTYSEIFPVYLFSLIYVFTFTGRPVDPEKVIKDLLREGDVIGFVTGGDKIQFGFVNTFVPSEESERLGLNPERSYISVSDKKGEILILPILNIGMIK